MDIILEHESFFEQIAINLKSIAHNPKDLDNKRFFHADIEDLIQGLKIVGTSPVMVVESLDLDNQDNDADSEGLNVNAGILILQAWSAKNETYKERSQKVQRCLNIAIEVKRFMRMLRDNIKHPLLDNIDMNSFRFAVIYDFANNAFVGIRMTFTYYMADENEPDPSLWKSNFFNKWLSQ